MRAQAEVNQNLKIETSEEFSEYPVFGHGRRGQPIRHGAIKIGQNAPGNGTGEKKTGPRLINDTMAENMLSAEARAVGHAMTTPNARFISFRNISAPRRPPDGPAPKLREHRFVKFDRLAGSGDDGNAGQYVRQFAKTEGG